MKARQYNPLTFDVERKSCWFLFPYRDLFFADKVLGPIHTNAFRNPLFSIERKYIDCSTSRPAFSHPLILGMRNTNLLRSLISIPAEKKAKDMKWAAFCFRVGCGEEMMQILAIVLTI